MKIRIGWLLVSLGVLAGACGAGTINVEESCNRQCSPTEACSAAIQHGEQLDLACIPIPPSCETAPDVCECVRTTVEGMSELHCSQAGARPLLLR